MTEPYRIRSPETWAQARDDYLSGLDAEAVCRRHDLGLSAFRRRARKYGWRRVDQADPEPDGQDLSIYDDINMDDQIQLARRRYLQALDRGRSVEAARWRRLWTELRAESAAFDAEFFAGMNPGEVAAFVALERPTDETEAEAALLAAPALASQPAQPTASENVHDVHSTFSSAQIPTVARSRTPAALEPPATARAERRPGVRVHSDTAPTRPRSLP